MQSGRCTRSRGRPVVSRPPVEISQLAALMTSLFLSGCGGLETPYATVTGKIVGATPAAYAYPLGRPDLKVIPSPSDGAFRIEAVPTSVEALVLYDGTDRAELVRIDVDGGAENRIEDRFGKDAPVDDAAKMPLYGSVLAAVVPDGGAVPRDPSFWVEETDLLDRHPLAGDGFVTLSPLPAGRFELTATLAGFRDRRVTVEVVAGLTVPAQLFLQIDPDGAAPGCEAANECENGLSCSPLDGRCYACTSIGGCGAGQTCDLAVGLCTPVSGLGAGTCEACQDDAGCASSSSVCVKVGGATPGYCSRACAVDADCSAGFACGGDGRCAAPEGCSAWLQTMGSTCVEPDQCAKDLAGGFCDRIGDAPGHCTASCTTDLDCRIGAGLAATLICATGGWCSLP
jgi:hypothetical protein